MTWLTITLKQLARDLRAQKLRTFLTTLGVVWGTVAVSLLMAFGQGFHEQLAKNQAGIGNGIVIAWPSQTSMPFEGLGKGRRIRLNEDDIQPGYGRLLQNGNDLLNRKALPLHGKPLGHPLA